MAPRVGIYVRDTLTAIRRNGLIAFAAVSTAFIALFLLGFALLLRQEFNKVVAQTQANIEVSVYLQDSLSSAQLQNLQSMLQSMPEVRFVRYESKDQAYQRFLQIFHNQPDLVQNVSKDALPASFRVKLKDASPRSVQAVRVRLAGQPGIDKIVDLRSFYHRLFQVTNIFKVTGYVMAFVMLLSALALIGNTVRMAVFDRRQEIGIMRLVGATNWRIRMPFLIEGLVEGLFGAAVAIAGLFIAERIFVDPLRNQIGFFPLIGPHDVILTIPVLIGSAVAVSVLASLIATARWLEV
jgi:cell division transport system permease protein